jgi:uncharacterized repeat protein (TIGR01451 family)
MRLHTLISRLRSAARGLAIAACATVVAAGFVAPAAAQTTGADVRVTKTVPDLPYSGGTTVEYSVTVESHGPATATTVVLTDPVPQGMTFSSVDAPAGWICGTPPVGGTGSIVCSTSAMSPGASAAFVIRLRINDTVLAGVRITNTASVDAQQPDPLPSNNSSSASFLVAGGSRDTAGVYNPGTAAWFLRNTNSAGPADLTFTYGPGGFVVPLDGDWNSDGIDTVAVYDPATGAFFLKNTNAGGSADIVFTFGVGGAGLVPLSGDWNGDGVDTIGLYDPATGNFFLRNSNSSGSADIVFTFGTGGAGLIPLAGDFDGDGTDTVGLYAPATGSFFLKNTNSGGAADLTFNFGPANSVPLVGDWDGDAFGRDTIGVYIPSTGSWFLRNTNSAGNADLTFVYGPPFLTPLGGDWNGL